MAHDRNSPLFSPGRIGPLHRGKRVIVALMTTRHADAEGFVTEEGLACYTARAAGGVGLVAVERRRRSRRAIASAYAAVYGRVDAAATA